jgi:hypothetical protein
MKFFSTAALRQKNIHNSFYTINNEVSEHGNNADGYPSFLGPGVMDNFGAEGIDQKLTALIFSVPEKHVEMGSPLAISMLAIARQFPRAFGLNY